MAHENKVVRSVNLPGAHHCVDFFRRLDGTFGYELYRRDPEESRGWYPVGFFAQSVFPSETAAIESACRNVPWLQEHL